MLHLAFIVSSNCAYRHPLQQCAIAQEASFHNREVGATHISFEHYLLSWSWYAASNHIQVTTLLQESSEANTAVPRKRVVKRGLQLAIQTQRGYDCVIFVHDPPVSGQPVCCYVFFFILSSSQDLIYCTLSLTVGLCTPCQ